MSSCLPSPSLLRMVLPTFSQRSTCWTWWAPFRAGHVRPVSGSLQAGIGFFQHPVPHLHGLSLRSACLGPRAARPDRLWLPTKGEAIGPCSGRNDPGRREPEGSPPGRKDRALPSIGRRYGVSTFRSRSPRGGRCLLSTGCRLRPRGVAVRGPFPAPSPFGPSLSASLARSHMTIGSQIHLRSPCPLSSPHLDRGSQEGSTLSRFRAPRDQHASAHCQGRSLFRPLDSPGGTGGPLISEDTS